MVDLRPVLHVVGWLLVLLAAFMLPPLLVDAANGDPEWHTFAVSAGLTVFSGLSLELGMRTRWRGLTVRQVYLVVALGWLGCCAFAALPFAFGRPQLPALDAMFEAVCGLTTTATTILTGLDRQPAGLLLWRALLQWLGGVGTLVMAVAVLPYLRIGGMQVFKVEMAGPGGTTSNRAIRMGATLLAAYTWLTAVLAALLWLAGMGPFDAWLHAMATLSTGGFSTWDGSIGHWNSAAVEIVVTVGMVVGGLPFLLFFSLAQGNFKAMYKNRQVRWYLGVMAAASVAMALWLAIVGGLGALDALRRGAFTTASAMTGTGFVAIDYGTWTGMPAVMLLFLGLLGGCAGSTTGGIKVFRLQMLLADAMAQMRQLRRPHAVVVASFDRVPIPDEARESVMGFLVVYALGFAALAAGLGFLGLDFVSALSGAAGAIANFGPGLGPVVGPGAQLAQLSDGAKILLAAGMLFGRLEMFPLLVLLTPTFWRQ